MSECLRERDAEIPPKLLALLRRILIERAGKPGHVDLRLHFGHGRELSARLDVPTGEGRGEWEIVRLS